MRSWKPSRLTPAGALCLCGMCLLQGCKSIDPAVVEAAGREGCWYRYMPQHAPGFCLRTRHAMVWKDDKLNLGYWRGKHPKAPHRVLMEARGNTFILHRRFVWDGNSVGPTKPVDLLPSLRHDALYHAFKEGAPIKRKDIDLAHLRDERQAGIPGAFLRYGILRLFGGAYNCYTRWVRGTAPTLILEHTTPDTQPAPLEPDHPDDDEQPANFTPPTA